jgi:hypothetical protein
MPVIRIARQRLRMGDELTAVLIGNLIWLASEVEPGDAFAL